MSDGRPDKPRGWSRAIESVQERLELWREFGEFYRATEPNDRAVMRLALHADGLDGPRTLSLASTFLRSVAACVADGSLDDRGASPIILLYRDVQEYAKGRT